MHVPATAMMQFTLDPQICTAYLPSRYSALSRKVLTFERARRHCLRPHLVILSSSRGHLVFSLSHKEQRRRQGRSKNRDSFRGALKIEERERESEVHLPPSCLPGCLCLLNYSGRKAHTTNSNAFLHWFRLDKVAKLMKLFDLNTTTDYDRQHGYRFLKVICCLEVL